MILDKNKVLRKMEEEALTCQMMQKELGIAYNAIIKARNGRPISAQSARKIAGALKCEPKDLLPDIE